MEPVIPNSFFMWDCSLDFLQHYATFWQQKLATGASGTGSSDEADVCVRDGVIKGKPSFEKRIYLLAKRI